MSFHHFTARGLFLGICLVLAAAFSPAARAQSLGVNCIQNLSNGEFKTNKAAQLASACQSSEIWYLSTVSGTNYYCIKNQLNGEYLGNRANSLEAKCSGNNQYWNITPQPYNGETLYCLQNVGNGEYLTRKAGKLAGSCGQEQYWRVYNPGWQCIRNQGNNEYLENRANSMSSKCADESTWWTKIPKRWFSVGSVGIRKTRANLYFSGHVRYVSMSEALSSSPSPRRGRNASSDGSSRAATAAARARASRSASSSASSSGDDSRISRCCAVAARRIAALMPGSASATD